MEETAIKSVPVYALQPPERMVVLHFLYPEAYLSDPANAGKAWHYETAAVISFRYNLTAKRRPQPSEEPERSIYRSLKPWKKVGAPRYVIVADDVNNLTGAQVLLWDGKKSLQGTPPWDRPVLGTVSGKPGHWAVGVDPIQLAVLKKIEFDKERAKLEAKWQKDATGEPETRSGSVVEMTPPQPTPTPEPPPFVIEAREPEEPIDWAKGYTGDAFAMTLDGHYLGDDGFIVPRSFDEFYERYPKYVLNWVKKRLNKFSVDDDVEDWTQDLLIHMKFLPQGSKHRLPGANGRELGCTDVVETFNPYQQYGASERRFRNYINFCLANKFNTMQSKRAKNPVCRPGNVAFDGNQDQAHSEHMLSSDEYVHQNSDHLASISARKEKQHDDRLFTNQFKRYVKKEDPSVYPAIEALEATGPLGEAAEYMGVTEQEFSRYRTRLKQLGECFLRATQAPKQRRKYRKRSTVTVVEAASSNAEEGQNVEKREPQLGQI
jgi:hypothetical protein